MNRNINRVFNISKLNETNHLFFPNQIFINKEFEFFLTIGGNIVDNNDEYHKLMLVLEKLEETSFFVLENVVAHTNKIPFFYQVSINSNFDIFQKIGKNFDKDFGWSIGNFFVYGTKETWGIYMCELPTINIIGCDKKYIDMFREVYEINGNGYCELKEFIAHELKNPELIRKLEENYKLELKKI